MQWSQQAIPTASWPIGRDGGRARRHTGQFRDRRRIAAGTASGHGGRGERRRRRGRVLAGRDRMARARRRIRPRHRRDRGQGIRRPRESWPTPRPKRRAHAQTGAVIVDLESAAVARSAAAAGIAFIVVRAVADAAGRALPPAALMPLTAAGTPDFSRLAAAVLRRPGQIARLIGLARDTRKGLAALARPARALRRVFAAG